MNNEMSKRWVSLYVENQIGVLAKISGLFSGKNYNIHSLTVGTTEDQTISRMDYVQLVFEERCHIPIELGTRYREAELSELEQYKEKKLAGEIEKILRHNSDTRKQKKQDDQPEKAPEELKDYDAKIKPFRPGRSGDPYKGRQAWSKTASADPEIIYGRDFQGEVTPLSQVDAGMANVVFRGQILETETRQLRNQKQLITFSVTDFTDSIMWV